MTAHASAAGRVATQLWRGGLLLLLSAGLAGSALAGDAVSGDTLIEADKQAILEILQDYDQVAKMNPDVLDYRVEADGACQLVHVTAKGVSSPTQYTVRRCATDRGLTERYVDGDGLIEDIQVDWVMVDEGEGTRVKLSVLTRVAKVPQFLVDQRTRSSVSRSLKQLAQKLSPKRR